MNNMQGLCTKWTWKGKEKPNGKPQKNPIFKDNSNVKENYCLEKERA